ncbi:MAG: AbgT family transporter, partial [Neisseriaceae bacterium]|nr:AbgT family transporter [Neisseriaceae bacterium]
MSQKPVPTPPTAGISKNLFNRFLDTVEWLGNLLPHPVTLFALFCLVIIAASGVAGYFGVSVVDPRPEGASGRAADGMIHVVSLVNAEGLQRILTEMVKNFTGFAPLGTVLVALLGVSLAEHSGLLSAAMRNLVMGASKRMVTIVVVFAGIMSNTAAELGYVMLIPLAAMLFYSLGRHPLAGLAAAFAGVSGGYSANLLLGTVDPLLSGITETSARMLDPSYVVGPEVNWYFMAASTFLITALGAFVTEKIVEPKLGAYNSSEASEVLNTNMDKLTPLEKRGLRHAGLAALVIVGLLALTIVPENGILRHPETGTITGSPFLKGIVVLIFVFFAVPGYVYGRTVCTMKKDT